MHTVTQHTQQDAPQQETARDTLKRIRVLAKVAAERLELCHDPVAASDALSEIAALAEAAVPR